MKFKNHFLKTIEKNIVNNINILGYMASGKTNLSLFLLSLINKHFPNYDNYYLSFNEEIAKTFSFYINIINKFSEEFSKKENVNIVIDDMSFLTHNNNTLNNTLSQIRHLLTYKKINLFLINHYIHSINPFLRLANIRFIGKLFIPYEIELLKKYFSLNDLWNFYHLKDKEFKFLANIEGYHAIIRVNLMKEIEENKDFFKPYNTNQYYLKINNFTLINLNKIYQIAMNKMRRF